MQFVTFNEICGQYIEENKVSGKAILIRVRGFNFFLLGFIVDELAVIMSEATEKVKEDTICLLYS